MRDLYARLSITPAASPAEIQSAIAACSNAELRSDADAVLCHADRRRTYDQLHATLRKIGGLRASLGLVQTRLWRGLRDFDGEVAGTGTRYGEFLRKQDILAAALRAEKVASKAAAPAFAWPSLLSWLPPSPTRHFRSWLRRGKSTGQARKP